MGAHLLVRILQLDLQSCVEDAMFNSPTRLAYNFNSMFYSVIKWSL